MTFERKCFDWIEHCLFKISSGVTKGSYKMKNIIYCAPFKMSLFYLHQENRFFSTYCFNSSFQHFIFMSFYIDLYEIHIVEIKIVQPLDRYCYLFALSTRIVQACKSCV